MGVWGGGGGVIVSIRGRETETDSEAGLRTLNLLTAVRISYQAQYTQLGLIQCLNVINQGIVSPNTDIKM